MERRSWPTLGLILIGCGFFSSSMDLMDAFANQSLLVMVFGLLGLWVWWNIYYLKSWGLNVLTVLMALRFLYFLVILLQGWGLMMCLLGMVYAVWNIVYFNSPEVKRVFPPR